MDDMRKDGVNDRVNQEMIVCYTRENGKTIRAEITGELVRCKDCKHWKHFRGGLGNCKHPKFVEPLTENYHFCGYGERKDGGNGSTD